MHGHFEDIIPFLTTTTMSKEYSIQQKKKLVVCATDFSASWGTYTKWEMMRYFKGTYLNLKKVRSSWKHMGVL